jgi:hypothetical protein
MNFKEVQTFWEDLLKLTKKNFSSSTSILLIYIDSLVLKNLKFLYKSQIGLKKENPKKSSNMNLKPFELGFNYSKTM